MKTVYRLGLLTAGSLCSVSDGVKQEEHGHSTGLCPEFDPELDVSGTPVDLSIVLHLTIATSVVIMLDIPVFRNLFLIHQCI